MRNVEEEFAEQRRSSLNVVSMELERIPWQEKGTPKVPALRRRLEADGYDVVEWTDPPNRVYEPHSHAQDECLWVVSGGIVFTIDGREYALGPGDRLMLPQGTLHGAKAQAAGATYLIGERE